VTAVQFAKQQDITKCLYQRPNVPIALVAWLLVIIPIVAQLESGQLAAPHWEGMTALALLPCAHAVKNRVRRLQ
jgi:hypothetical protein